MPRATHRFVLLVGAGVTALTLALAGCSSSPSAENTQSPTPEPPSASPTSFMAQAAAATQSAGSAKVTLNSTITTSQQRVGEITVKGGGVVDFANQALDMSLTMSASALGMNQTIKMIAVDGKSYLQMSMLGDKWIEAPISQSGVNVQDPTQSLKQLQELGDLKEAGTEDINGAPATKYTGTIDIAKALASAGMSEEQVRELGDLSKVGKTAEVTVWVDAEDRVVRMDQTLTMTIAEQGRMTMKTSAAFSDFGVETNIAPPPASEVTQMPTGIPSPSVS